MTFLQLNNQPNYERYEHNYDLYSISQLDNYNAMKLAACENIFQVQRTKVVFLQLIEPMEIFFKNFNF